MAGLQELKRYFREGMKAREDGLQLADNPYDLGSDAHGEWGAGWAATYDLDEDNDPESCRDHGIEP